MRIEDFDEYGRPVYFVDVPPPHITLVWAQAEGTLSLVRATALADNWHGVGYGAPERCFTSYDDALRFAAMEKLGED